MTQARGGPASAPAGGRRMTVEPSDLSPRAGGADPAAAADLAGAVAGEAPAPAGGLSRGVAWYLNLGSRARTGLVAGVIAIAVIVGLALAGSAGGTPATAPAPPARNFSAPVLGHPGQQLSLSAYAGKPVIVNFFASWCAPCQRETPMLAAYYRTSHGRIPVIGIDVNDGTASAQAFVHKTGVRYPVAVDAPPMPVAAAYNVSGLPQTFFLNDQHRIVKRVLGALTRQKLAAGTALISPHAK